MSKLNHYWLREERLGEKRAPLTPSGAVKLRAAGYEVTVEKSQQRVFPDDDYGRAGCRLAKAGSWIEAPRDAVILGLKELPNITQVLRHTHIFFGHAYKGQTNAEKLLQQFRSGGGALLDIEYMTDADGKRVAAFGGWAGTVGAALALIHWYDLRKGISTLSGGVEPFENMTALKSAVRASHSGDAPRVIVIGAKGRSGSKAAELCREFGAQVIEWGRKDTRNIDRGQIAKSDILINCPLIREAVQPFLRADDLAQPRDLSVVADVSCDLGALNPLPFYNTLTSWEKPVERVHGSAGHVDVISIDNLPSLLPRESSEDFASGFLSHLLSLSSSAAAAPWRHARAAYDAAIGSPIAM